MPSIELPANGKCPKCGAHIKMTRYEPHPVKDLAYAYYDCEKCGKVMAKVIDIGVPNKK